MRVPGISPTAGYAASIHCEAFLSEQQFYASLQSPIDRNKDNGNFQITNQQETNLQQVANEYASSADEFVTKALSSVPNSIEVKSNLEFLRACNESKSAIKQSPTECAYTSGDSNQYNTYRSFKDAFNINKTFYEECVKNLDNINAHDIDHTHIQDEDVDPILIINTPYPAENYPPSPTTATENMKNSTIETGNSNAILEEKSNTDDVVGPYSKNPKDVDPFNDNDYDDQTMLDLCEEDNNEVLNEVIDRESYLTSPTSSSISDHTPKRTFSYFPRGIINPNYPGFQHLAHTLSEHFITGVSPSDSYDSDMSEYEMELSADSFEDLSDEANEQFNLRLNRFNNNFENHHIRAHSHMRTETQLKDMRNNICETFAESAENGDDNCNVDIHDLPISLKTTLTLLESVPAQASMSTSTAIPEIYTTNDFIQYKSEANYAITPPDILMKSEHTLHVKGTILKKENRPDLLYGVSPHHMSNKVKFADQDKSKLEVLPRILTRSMLESPMKDEMSLGVTPVDIIGDFGQEVEREFGLLVSGYRRLMDAPTESNDNELEEQDNEIISQQKEHLTDAMLSNVNDEIDANKYITALKQFGQQEHPNFGNPFINIETVKNSPSTTCDFIEDNNAVDWSCASADETDNKSDQQLPAMIITPAIDSTSTTCTTNEDANTAEQEDESKSTDNIGNKKSKYRKSSYDERQLPPVAIEYKRCQQSQRNNRKTQHMEKSSKNTKKPSFANRFLHGKRGVIKSSEQINASIRKREEAEIYQYQQLISDKELIVSNSRYTKLSSWAQYLKNSVKDNRARNSTELISPSALELFDAYKVGGEVDRETLQKHLKMAKEIEKKRRSDREEIRRRLAMGAEENSNTINERPNRKSNLQKSLHNGLYICRLNDVSSDTESHSSDSETCPKLSKTRQQNSLGPFIDAKNDNTSPKAHPYHGRPLSVSCTNTQQQQQREKQIQQQQKQKNQELLPITDEDKECDFFTKQARLQIEARMALAQAKEMAHMQMEFERQNRRMSPITGIIRSSLDKIGVQMSMDKRRVSRQMLTDMNIAQLQILVNSLHTHIEELNESLVQFLMERDDLHVGQDSMLVDIEELTRFIGAQEHLTHQHKKTTKCNRSK